MRMYFPNYYINPDSDKDDLNHACRVMIYIHLSARTDRYMYLRSDRETTAESVKNTSS